ncbi:MAG: hypothetical protein HC834_03420 [Rhodospirillales bacterium]|nr:hypothetical protein [Rhodospirillales bacterium]
MAALVFAASGAAVIALAFMMPALADQTRDVLKGVLAALLLAGCVLAVIGLRRHALDRRWSEKLVDEANSVAASDAMTGLLNRTGFSGCYTTRRCFQPIPVPGTSNVCQPLPRISLCL